MAEPPPQPAVLLPSAGPQTLNAQQLGDDIRVAGDHGVGDPIPVAYGRVQVGCSLEMLHYNGGDEEFTGCFVICLGEIESVDRVFIDNALAPDLFAVNTYTGTATQSVDPLLRAAYGAANYDATLTFSHGGSTVGVAYVVLQWGTDDYDTIPEVVAEIRGKKIYDYATNSTRYSETPALFLADLLTSTLYGYGGTVDSTDAALAQAANETRIGSAARRTAGIVIDFTRPHDEYRKLLEQYSATFANPRGAIWGMRADRPSAADFDLTDDRWISGTLSFQKGGSSREDPPNACTVEYTHIVDGAMWETRTYTHRLPGVADADLIEKQIRLPGVNNGAQAIREAEEWLAKRRRIEGISFVGTDAMALAERGDKIRLGANPLGIPSGAIFQVLDAPSGARFGRPVIRGTRQADSDYSDNTAEPSAENYVSPLIGEILRSATITANDGLSADNNDTLSFTVSAVTADTGTPLTYEWKLSRNRTSINAEFTTGTQTHQDNDAANSEWTEGTATQMIRFTRSGGTGGRITVEARAVQGGLRKEAESLEVSLTNAAPDFTVSISGPLNLHTDSTGDYDYTVTLTGNQNGVFSGGIAINRTLTDADISGYFPVGLWFWWAITTEENASLFYERDDTVTGTQNKTVTHNIRCDLSYYDTDDLDLADPTRIQGVGYYSTLEVTVVSGGLTRSDSIDIFVGTDE